MTRDEIASQVLAGLVNNLAWKPDAMLKETEDGPEFNAGDSLCESAVKYADKLLAKLKETE